MQDVTELLASIEANLEEVARQLELAQNVPELRSMEALAKLLDRQLELRTKFNSTTTEIGTVLFRCLSHLNTHEDPFVARHNGYQMNLVGIKDPGKKEFYPMDVAWRIRSARFDGLLWAFFDQALLYIESRLPRAKNLNEELLADIEALTRFTERMGQSELAVA